MNNLNRGKVAVGISLKVFEELLQELQKQDLFQALSTEQSFSLIEGNESLVVTAHVDVDLEPVKFRLHGTGSSKHTRLIIAGRAKLRVSSPHAESPNLFDLPFSIKLKLDFKLKNRANKAPQLGLEYNGIASMSGPFPQDKITELIESQGFVQLLNNFQLDLIDPAINGLEEALFLNETKPNRADWEVGLHLLPGSGSQVDSVALIVDIPGGNVSKPSGGSFVPSNAEIIVQFTSSMMQALVNEAKEELTSWFEDINGVDLRVSRLDLTVDNDQFYLDAKVVEKKYDADGRIWGPIYLSHAPGSMNISLNVRDLATDIDLPWWADVLVFLADVFTLGLVGVSDTIHNRLPNMGQAYLQKALDDMLPKLGDALSFDNLAVQNIDIEVYPDDIDLNDGAVTVKIQVLIQKLVEEMLRGDYSKLRERFVMFHLQSGRRFMASHLASFMKRELIEINGYHDVDGRFIRSNPDNTENNNLLERFGR